MRQRKIDFLICVTRKKVRPGTRFIFTSESHPAAFLLKTKRRMTMTNEIKKDAAAAGAASAAASAAAAAAVATTSKTGLKQG